MSEKQNTGKNKHGNITDPETLKKMEEKRLKNKLKSLENKEKKKKEKEEKEK